MSKAAEKKDRRDQPAHVSTQEAQKRDTNVAATIITQIAVVIVAAIGCISAVSVAFLNSPLVPRLFPPTPTVALVAETPTVTPILPTVTFTPFNLPATPTEVQLPSLTEPLPTSTIEPAISKMTVILTASMEEGKSPLPVNFNARDSFVQFADGNVAACGSTGFCTFTWAIYRDQKRVVAPFQGQGTFSYTFSGRGVYSVTVYVCREDTCADDGIVITVK